MIRDSVKQSSGQGEPQRRAFAHGARRGGEFLPDFSSWTLYAKHHDSDRLVVLQTPVECIRERKEAE